MFGGRKRRNTLGTDSEWGEGKRLEEIDEGLWRSLESMLTLLLHIQIVNPKGEMKGSAITGPVGKEAAELWPVSIIDP